LKELYGVLGRKLPDTSAVANAADPNDAPTKRKCLEAILFPSVATGVSSNKHISLERFGLLLTWFGPLVPVDKSCILDKVHFTLRESWFHGDINRDESIRLMKREPDPGKFLIRTSTIPQQPFTISRLFRDRNGSTPPQSQSSPGSSSKSSSKPKKPPPKTDHLRISYNNGTFTLQFKQEEKGKTLTFSAPTLPALINDKKLWKALKLKHPIMRQRFSDIFTYTQDMPGYQGTDFCQTPMPDDNDDDSDE